MQMNDKGSYFWSWLTGVLAALSLQDIIFAAGAVFTAIFTVYTYLSNDRKNKALASEARRQTDILEQMADGKHNVDPDVLVEIISHLQKTLR